MKKLLVAFAVAAFAVTANAATYAWSNPYGLDAYNQPNDAAFAAGTIYLMSGDASSQAAFITTVLAATDYQAAFNSQVASAVKTGTLTADGTFNGGASIEFEASESYSYYQVMIDTVNNGVYVSELMSGEGSAVGTNPLDFYNDAAYANAAFGSDVKTFSGAGWYTAAAVPEPTSGLLMLVGLAGLALRRRRA